MLALRPAAERGHANHGWLDSRFSFSFADYHDPAQMGWGALRVINDDWIEPGQGFGMHGHRNMEIVTYVLSGAVTHRDSLGSGSTIQPGEVQRMSAGKGIVHSEFNLAASERLHLLQIWIEPAAPGGSASYAQASIPPAGKREQLCLIAGPAGSGALVSIGQNARLYASELSASGSLSQALAAGRLAYVHLISGALKLNGLAVQPGDGVKIADEALLHLHADADSEFLLFDLPPSPRQPD